MEISINSFSSPDIEKASRFVKGQRLKIDVIKTPTNKLEAINAVPDVETYGCPHLLEDFRITYQDQKIDLSKTDKYEVTLPNPGKILSKNETWAVKVEGR